MTIVRQIPAINRNNAPDMRCAKVSNRNDLKNLQLIPGTHKSETPIARKFPPVHHFFQSCYLFSTFVLFLVLNRRSTLLQNKELQCRVLVFRVTSLQFLSAIRQFQNILPASFRGEAHAVVTDERVDASLYNRGRNAQHHTRQSKCPGWVEQQVSLLVEHGQPEDGH
jgi:hypothetical protein